MAVTNIHGTSTASPCSTAAMRPKSKAGGTGSSAVASKRGNPGFHEIWSCFLWDKKGNSMGKYVIFMVSIFDKHGILGDLNGILMGFMIFWVVLVRLNGALIGIQHGFDGDSKIDFPGSRTISGLPLCFMIDPAFSYTCSWFNWWKSSKVSPTELWPAPCASVIRCCARNANVSPQRRCRRPLGPWWPLGPWAARMVPWSRGGVWMSIPQNVAGLKPWNHARPVGKIGDIKT